MKISFLNIFFLLIIAKFGVAQNITFEASAPKSSQTGQPFMIKYTLKAPKKGKNFVFPKVDGLEIVNQGTSQFSSFSTTIVNGKMSSEQTITLVWSLTVVASIEKKYSIPSATVTVDGKTYSSNNLTIDVSKGNAQTSNTPTTQNADATVVTKDLLINLSTNKTTAYVGEPIYAYCKLFSVYNISLNEFNPSPYNNFWIKEIPMPTSIKAQEERINNKTYLTAVLDKRLIFPQKTGSITIDPYQATLQLYDGWGFPAQQKKVVSNTKTIEVKPLPSNKPASFTGGVGEFEVDMNADLITVEIDQAITIDFKISGLGNFGLFDLPEVTLPATFERLEPDFTENLSIQSDGLSGSQSVRYVFIPRVPGQYYVKPISFAFFDLQQEKYVILKTDSLKITVVGDSSSSFTNQVVQSDPTQLGNDVRFIKNSVKLKPQNNFIFGKTGFWLAYIIPLLTLGFLTFFMRKKIKQNADLKLVKSKKADKVSKKRLKLAQSYMVSNNNEKFYEEVSLALWGYVSDKMSIPRSELTRQTVVETLKSKNISDQIVSDFVKIIDNCEVARFAPSAVGFNPQQIYSGASSLISNFEKNI
ncbi:MAG: protein BatD [Bacteroidales bacterium]|nr:protein BatD [Bacteroidales bacterium]